MRRGVFRLWHVTKETRDVRCCPTPRQKATDSTEENEVTGLFWEWRGFAYPEATSRALSVGHSFSYLWCWQRFKQCRLKCLPQILTVESSGTAASSTGLRTSRLPVKHLSLESVALVQCLLVLKHRISGAFQILSQHLDWSQSRSWTGWKGSVTNQCFKDPAFNDQGICGGKGWRWGHHCHCSRPWNPRGLWEGIILPLHLDDKIVQLKFRSFPKSLESGKPFLVQLVKARLW